MEQYITKHFNPDLLTCKIYDVNTICSYSGKKIYKGVKMKDVITERFTDMQIFKYKNGYLSIDFALMISPIIKTETGLNSLRNYSFFASDNFFTLLQRDNILELVLNIKHVPFQIAITYSNKKHLSYKTPINIDKNIFTICTDEGNFLFDVNKAKKILPVIQNWYTITKNTSQQPTFFNKSQIKGETIPNIEQVKEYGMQKFFDENIFLNAYRGTLFFNFLVHILNKKQ